MSNDAALDLNPKLQDLSAEYVKWMKPFLMSQRRSLLAQVDSIEELLEITPSTADLRKQAKCDRMDNKQ